MIFNRPIFVNLKFTKFGNRSEKASLQKGKYKGTSKKGMLFRGPKKTICKCSKDLFGTNLEVTSF